MTPPNDFATRLEGLMEKATKGPLMIYDSCSWRRIGLANGYKEVLWPCVSQSDGHPDLSGINRDNDLALWMFLANHATAIARLVRIAEQVFIQETVGEPYSPDAIDKLGEALAELNAEDKT